MTVSATSGAIDLGGTKIEARLFDAGLNSLQTRRIDTPTTSYAAMMEALCAQIDWLLEQSGQADLPVGICVPGVIDPESGIAFAANVPITGENPGQTLAHRYGREFPLENDCMALALSEANGGAGEGYSSVVGLIMGTGVGAGFALSGSIPMRHGGIAVEIGHIGMPADILARHGLPVSPCGCGRKGCMERYVAGSGLGRLSEWLTGTAVAGPEVVSRAAAGDARMAMVLDVWTELAVECLLTLQLTLAPQCIVIGGGVSRMPGLVERLQAALAVTDFGALRLPQLRIAEHGDSSGARGMALLAVARRKMQKDI
ncbi:ROK family protein [Falsirhodobacter sp. alg1]|uniref:ROK family protein n=1 Tax=Falsirhodobacter sp. alg1 TaxID=1472418 RepID=UPI0005ED47AF|nr:ROK family protein [Falsirhodobacter sp. alg1]